MHISPMWISGILWIAFILYWSAKAKDSAPTVSAESAGSRQLHQLLMYGSLALAFWRFSPLDRRFLPSRPIWVAIGLALQVASFALGGWARAHLGKNWSGAVTTKADHQLVRSGPYRFIRHPIYAAMLGMMLGTAVVSGELHGLLAFAVLSGAYVRKIRLEERRLGEIFGSDYTAYRHDTGAVIPWVL